MKEQERGQLFHGYLKPGETYVGTKFDVRDKPEYHLIAIPVNRDKVCNFKEALYEARAAGGNLPKEYDIVMLQAWVGDFTGQYWADYIEGARDDGYPPIFGAIAGYANRHHSEKAKLLIVHREYVKGENHG